MVGLPARREWRPTPRSLSLPAWSVRFGVVRKRVVSSRFIGRAGELGQLNQALEAAAEGRASVALVGGESGVGKTRLLAELMRGARDDGALVLAGDCVGVGEQGELPYLSLVSALRPLARASDAALSDAVAPLLPGIARPSEVERGGQVQLFEGLLALLEALGRQRPVLLVIEDLHWADRSTRAALTFLARSLTVERVLLVGSYRSDELRRGHPLRSLLAELGASRISLEPFTREEMGELIVDVLGEPPAAQQLDRLFARSGGNPLFGEELLAAGLDGSGAAPETLRDALMLRVERLSADARGLLQLVAVGQRLDHGVLEQTSALEPGPLRDALREAVDAHILTFAGDGQYRFRHALLREVVEADLLPGERAEMHLALARALERRLESDADAQTAATVAHHYAATTDRRAALSSAARAARVGQRVHAHAEAAALLERVLELWDRVADPETLVGADRVAILVHAAESASALARPGRQLELLEAAMAELGPAPEPLRAAAILESVAQAQRHMNRTSESIATLERALELAETGADRPVRARVLAGLARARMLVGDYERAAPMARQALELAAAAELPALEASARNTLGYAL